MKRNNQFMLAYIIFILIAGVVRAFGDYPMWKVIVAAITMSSWFFAYADADNICASAASQTVNIWKKYIEESQNKAKKMLAKIDEEKAKHVDSEDTEAEALKIKLNIIDYTTEGLQSADQSINEMSHLLEKNEKKVKKYEKRSAIFTVLGFLVFFSTMAFRTISDYVINMQDIATVTSFAIILSAQYLGDMMRVDNDQLEVRAEKLLCDITELQSQLEGIFHAD